MIQLTSYAITRALKERFPRARISTRHHPELPGHWIVQVPEKAAQELWIVPATEPGSEHGSSHLRSAELLSRILGHAVWVSGFPRRVRGRGPVRYLITVRDEESLGVSP